MLKVKVSGTYYFKTGHKTNDKKNFEEEFLIHDKFESRPLQVIQRMLIDSRLKGVDPKCLGRKTCNLDGAILTKTNIKKLDKDEVYKLKDHEILEYKAQKGTFIQGTKLGHIRTYRQELIAAAPEAPVQENDENPKHITDPVPESEDSPVNLSTESEFSTNNENAPVQGSPDLDNEFEERV